MFALRSSRRNAAQVPCASLRSGRGPTGPAEYRPAPTTRLVAVTPATGDWSFDEPLLRRLGPRCRPPPLGVVIVWIVSTVAAVVSLPTLASQVGDNNGAYLPAGAPSNQAALLAEP